MPMGIFRRRRAFAASGLLAMAAAAARVSGAPASEPPQAVEDMVSLAETSGGALDNLLVEGVLKSDAFRLWREAGCGFRKTEHAAWIVVNADADVSLVGWPARGLVWKEVWKGPPPSGVVAIIHTHPDAVDPRPSDKDVATSRAFGIPNYTVSRRGIWKATPEGETVQLDGEAWFVRCAGPAGCAVKAPARAAAVRPGGFQADARDGSP
jgi:hypothetical protein